MVGAHHRYECHGRQTLYRVRITMANHHLGIGSVQSNYMEIAVQLTARISEVLQAIAKGWALPKRVVADVAGWDGIAAARSVGDRFVREGQRFRFVSDGRCCVVPPSVCARSQQTPDSHKQRRGRRLGDGPGGKDEQPWPSSGPRTLCGK
ncbi:hypothetical protein BGX38DRAFT_757131 [Terfezia claveryi]|nr:hypothetical protein BGX38DRAFT_757131 [Terfezia claveryi]